MLACGAGAGIHSVWAAYVLGDIKLMAVCLVATVFLLETRWKLDPDRPATRRETRWWRFRWTVNFVSLLAFLFVGYTVHQHFGGSGGFGLFAGRPQGDRMRGAPATARESYTGVILHLEKLIDVAVVPPPRPLMADDRHSPQILENDELRIPFAGVYWFYRPPDRMPPANSIHMTGSPDLRRYISLGGWPIRMEARQDVGRSIRLNCCSRIAIALSNGDQYRSTVSVELVLVDTTHDIPRATSLGSLPVENSPAFRRSIGEPVELTLTYNLPPAREINEFNEFRVVFHLAKMRVDRSPKIAVKHFTLIPAGL